MDREQLEIRGFRQVSVAELFQLTPEEQALVELKLILSRAIRKKRLEEDLTQKDLARKMGSSQSRISKMEAGDPSISIDLQCRVFLVGLGASLVDLASIIEEESELLSPVGSIGWKP